MKSQNESRVVSLKAFKRKRNKQKMCPCRISAICLALIMLFVFLSGACVVLRVVWWHSVELIFGAVIVGAVVPYAAAIYMIIKGIETKPHHSDCLNRE